MRAATRGPREIKDFTGWVALAALSVVLLGCSATSSPTAAVTSNAASAGRTSIGPVISPPPVTPPTPPGTNLPAFACTDATGGSTGIVGVTAVRVDQHAGYDRFVLQFDTQVPKYTVKRQAKPVFTQGASGQTITLSGTAGVLVTVHSASQSGTYSGPTDFTQAGFPVLKEARLTEDFEGTVAWGLGLGTPACMRVFTLT
ncbi:MAG TPA: hypothetical protein VKU35_06380, partial [Candidatus Limnocylindria bacterium]|nr:hypothetical protein [Candidatus Limnocylindria bacterium]